MSTKDDTPSLDHPTDDQSLVVRRSASGDGKEADWISVPAASGASAAVTADPAIYLHALRRHWLLGTVLGIICAVLCGVLTLLLLPKYYTATSLIRVSMQQEAIVFEPKQRAFRHDFQVFKVTQLDLLRSPLVLTAALREPEINSLSMVKEESDPITWLQEELEVLSPEDSEIVKVSLADYDPAQITVIVNAVVSAYLTDIVQVEENQRRRRLSELERVYTDKEDETRQKRAALKGLADQLGTTDKDTLSVQQQIAVRQFGDLQNTLSKQKWNRSELEGELEAATAMRQRVDEASVPEFEVQELLMRDPAARELLKNMAGLRQIARQQQEAVVPGATVSSADRFSRDLMGVEEEYDYRENEIREQLRESKRAEVQEVISGLTVQVAIAKEQEKQLAEEVDAQREEIEQIGKTSVDVEMMRAELENLEHVLATVAEERESLKVELRSRSRIQLVQPADEPETPDNRYVKSALAVLSTIVGMVLPICGIVYWDIRKKRINSSEDVAKRLGLPVIGSVPVIPGRAIRRLNAPSSKNRQWNVRLTESIDSIAAKLLRDAAIDENRVVLITSAVGGEGKTTLATQVAMSLARTGRRTVLVDFDLRRPAIDKAFQLPLDPGVSEAICGEVEVQQVVQQTSTTNLFVVTAGRCDRHALRALANGADRRLFEELRSEYEFVVIDGSPILPVADTRFVAQHVDTVVLSVFRDYSRAPKVMAACEILEDFGVQHIEAVVTSSTEDEYGVASGHVASVAS